MVIIHNNRSDRLRDIFVVRAVGEHLGVGDSDLSVETAGWGQVWGQVRIQGAV